MSRLTDKKIVLVTRLTRLAELVNRFNTVSQARFYVEHQGVDFADYVREHEVYEAALREAQDILAQLGRVQAVDRGFLPNFIFAPEDIVVTLGQDGLVANTLKYLDGQPLVGVNPDPPRWDGKLLPFQVGDLKKVIPDVFANERPVQMVTMARARLNNGQVMHAVNDLFIGPKSHGSARYVIRSGEGYELHSSSGVIVSTGMGSTGWLKSLLTGAVAVSQAAATVMSSQGAKPAKAPSGEHPAVATGVETGFAWDSRFLCFTVREPFPTKTTGASLVFGRVTSESPLHLESQMAGGGVIFSDGIEKDYLEFNSGAQAIIDPGDRRGVLVI